MTQEILNWIGGAARPAASGRWLDKLCPHSGDLQGRLADSDGDDVAAAVQSAKKAFPAWATTTPVRRGQLLGEIVSALRARTQEFADCIAVETGKPPEDALGELNAALLQGEYFAGEGMRLYARSLSSGMVGKQAHSVRCPRGVAGLIVPANTPMANIAWKVFPALICGNTAVLKASEDSPRLAYLFAELCCRAGLPAGVLNVVQGRGDPAGRALVLDPTVALISFTGSTAAGRWIGEQCGASLKRVSLELGGKNPFVVCDDADLDQAVHWAALSAFSNAGQRCAAGSRIIVFRGVYETFRALLLEKTRSLKLGVSSGCNLGPVMHKRQQQSVLAAIDRAVAEGGRVLCGGKAPDNQVLANGAYVLPTLIEGLPDDATLCHQEIFGPVATLQVVDNLDAAIALANATEYGLTAAIHTRSVDRALKFVHAVRCGVANVNFGTFGSEPHMPFGGFGASGNGSREPGVEALDVYSELKNISFLLRPEFA